MFRAPYPAHLPHFSYVLDNVPGSIDQKAKLLDISPATLGKYRARGQVPRVIHLALFWEYSIHRVDFRSVHITTHFAVAQALKLTKQIHEISCIEVNEMAHAALISLFPALFSPYDLGSSDFACAAVMRGWQNGRHAIPSHDAARWQSPALY